MSRLDNLKKSASEVGLVIRSWSPGAGVTYYRFIRADAPEIEHNYFSAWGSNRVHTALGIKEAETFLDGFWTGYRTGRNNSSSKLDLRSLASYANRCSKIGGKLGYEWIRDQLNNLLEEN